MRVIETDNFGRDYPNEKFKSGIISEAEAQELANRLNVAAGPHSDRYYRVVEDNYALEPGFQP